jgi:hypothetical protein
MFKFITKTVKKHPYISATVAGGIVLFLIAHYMNSSQAATTAPSNLSLNPDGSGGYSPSYAQGGGGGGGVSGARIGQQHGYWAQIKVQARKWIPSTGAGVKGYWQQAKFRKTWIN